jgi:hypothetical protein
LRVVGAIDYAIECDLQSGALFGLRGDSEIGGDVNGRDFRIRKNDLRERKRMNGTDKDATTCYPETVETLFKFAGTFVAVSDARDATRLMNILGEHSGELNSQRFCFSTTRSRKDNAMALGLIGVPLTRISPQFFGDAEI